MALDIKGGYESVGGIYAIQPNRSITEKNDGTLEGSIRFKCDRDNFLMLPQIGAQHHDDYRLEIYQRDITYMPNSEVAMDASYFGLVSSPTEKQIVYSGGQNNEPIETHPDFEDFAGTKETPKNGAKFDAETGEFLGFLLPSGGDNNFRGTEYYLTPATLISVSYWMDRAPRLKKRMSIVKKISGFVTPPDVKDFLLLDTPYRQVGSFYQVTEQYLGSGPAGFNPIIYDA